MIEAEAGIRPNALAIAREMIARKWPSKYRIALVSKHPESLSQYEQKTFTFSSVRLIRIAPLKKSGIGGVN